MKIKDPSGRVHEVTEKAFRVVYAPLGYTAAGEEPEGGQTEGGQTEGGERLTAGQYEEAVKNRSNAESKLAELGVEYNDALKADELKELLKNELAARGMLPDGH